MEAQSEFAILNSYNYHFCFCFLLLLEKNILKVPDTGPWVSGNIETYLCSSIVGYWTLLYVLYPINTTE